MPKLPINSFNAGELSPYLYARSDFDKYSSGCLVMENFVPLPYGGATRRPAVEYFGEASDSDLDGNSDKVRIVPFVPGVNNTVLLEFGNLSLRIWDNGTLVTDGSETIVLDTPYSDSEIFDLKFAQSVDVMWIVHPSHPDKKLSRISSTEWSLEDEEFEVPPLREENDTDIKLYTSGTNGTATLTASRSFFDADMVGGYFKLKSIRNTDEQIDNQSVSGEGFGNWINMSNSDWEFQTTGNWKGRVVLQKKAGENGIPEDYITIGDSIGVTDAGRRNYEASSDKPEPFNTYIRVRYIQITSSLDYELKPNNIYIESLVKVIDYTDSTNVTVEIISPFQDLVSDYSEHSASTTYNEGDKVYIEGGLEFDSTTDLTTISAFLTDIQGSDFGGDQYWFVTDDGGGSVYLRKVDSGLSTLDASYDLSSQFDTVHDVAFYANTLYITGSTSGGSVRVKSFTTGGVFVSTEKNLGNTNDGKGLGYYNGYFYEGRNPRNGKSILKRNLSFGTIGVNYNTSDNDAQNDISGYDGLIYVCNQTNDAIDVYTEKLDLIEQIDISTELGADHPVGVLHDGTNLCVITSGDDLHKYNVTSDRVYYEYTDNDSDMDSFANQYGEGRWSERNPETKLWSEGAFSDYRGHPRAVGLFENRLCYAGTDADPDTIWLSQIDNYSNFRIGTVDSDSMRITLGAGSIDDIQWLLPQEKLIIGASGAEWTLGASDERKAITPTGFDLKRKTTYGSSSIQGIHVNSAAVFLMRQGRKVREWDYRAMNFEYTPPDLSILAEHITDGGIVEWAYQQQPDNILWCIRSDGTLVGLTYERDQNVIGWHRHSNDEFEFESVAVIPRSNEEDEVWVSVKIVVDGSTKRYIGRLNDREWGSDYLTEWQGSDLYKVYSNPASHSLTGLDYLEGEAVTIVADGDIIDSHPYTVTIAGTGVIDGDISYNGRASSGNFPRYAAGDTLLDNDGNWYLFNGSTLERWNNTSGTGVPPKTGWGTGSSGSPAPTLSYDINIVDTSTIIVPSDTYVTVTVGLPFTSILAPLWLSLDNQYGTSKGSKISCSEALIRFKDTFSAKCGQSVSDAEPVRWDNDESALYNDDAVALFENESEFLLTTYVVQDEPMPCTVLAMIPIIGGR